MKAQADYPFHDEDGYLAFIMGMWFNTRAKCGKTTLDEIRALTPGWSTQRRFQLAAMLRERGQLQ